MDADGVSVYARPVGDFTLTFDLSRKRCTGWYDMRTGECYECPSKRAVSEKYEQCPECQQKTGFNPAFYNTTELSVQQAELNKKPHLLYLAYFSLETVKVGISNAGRGWAGLLGGGPRAPHHLRAHRFIGTHHTVQHHFGRGTQVVEIDIFVATAQQRCRHQRQHAQKNRSNHKFII